MILGLIEHDRGGLNKASLEMLTLAKSLGKITAVIIGEEGRSITHELGKYGVKTVYHIIHEKLDDYAPEAMGKSLAQLSIFLQAQAILAAGSERGNEVIAHAAALMDLPMATNCTQIQPNENEWMVTRIRWGGSLLEEARLTGKTKLLTIAPHIIVAEESVNEEVMLIEYVPDLIDKDFRVRVTSRLVPESDKVSLADARVVVSGGRGVGSSSGFESLEELAQLLGGAIGCSRVVTNKGWRPHADQVGQTGARVSPDLYIACGISGAIQHWVGCKGAKKILVINTDPEAPLVAKADYAVIADLHEIVPAINEEIRKNL